MVVVWSGYIGDDVIFTSSPRCDESAEVSQSYRKVQRSFSETTSTYHSYQQDFIIRCGEMRVFGVLYCTVHVHVHGHGHGHVTVGLGVLWWKGQGDYFVVVGISSEPLLSKTLGI